VAVLRGTNLHRSVRGDCCRPTQFKPNEIAAWQWIAAIITYVLFLGGHSHIFGVSPFPG
jgi:hypothetical protein